jgi:hypothetical protein
MSNPYGIELNQAWTEWAADYGVSSTVAAAVFLISTARPIDEVMAKLAPGELEQVADIVPRWPDRFPPGTLAALKSRGLTPSSDLPAVRVSTDQSRRQSTEPRSGKKHGSIGNPFGIALDQAWLRWAAAEGVTETVIAAVSLLHERSVDEIAGKLTRAELADVTRLVSRCPSHYPPGAFDALKALRNVAAEQPAARTTAGAGANRPRRRYRRAFAELPAHTERPGLADCQAFASRPISRADRALSHRAAKSTAALAIRSASRLTRHGYGGLPLRA